VFASKSDFIPLGSINTNLGMSNGMQCTVSGAAAADKTIECDQVSPA